MLQISSGIDEPGGLRWQLVVSLFAAWTIVFVALLKGVKSFGKVINIIYYQSYLDSLNMQYCYSFPGRLLHCSLSLRNSDYFALPWTVSQWCYRWGQILHFP